MTDTYQNHLHQLIDHHFNEEELRTLCFSLGVDYDNLGGRGKADNARELIAFFQRRNNLPELLGVLRRARPNVPWPDPPPPPDLTALDAQQAERQRLWEQVKELLFLHVWGFADRQALLTEAFYPAHLWILEQIDVDGAAAVFMAHLWSVLDQRAPDGSLTIRLLRTLQSRYGAAEQQQLEELISTWQRLCAARQARLVTSPVTKTSQQPPAEMALTETAGRPILFLSYAGSDAHAARRLASGLAAYGYACRLEQASKEDNDAWLAATAAALGSAYAVLLLVGEQTADNRWQRLEYLAAADRQKPILALRLKPGVRLPAYLAPEVEDFLLGETDGDGLAAILSHLPPPPPPGDHAWVNEAEALRPRLAELAYMDRLKLAELQHVSQYTRLGGRSEIRRNSSGRLQLAPVVARQEFHYAPWQPRPDVEQRRFSDAVAELKAIGRAVLLGDPGSGKTTTFYKLAADLIDSALADPTTPVPLLVAIGRWTDADEPFPDFLRHSAGELGDGLEQRLAERRVALLLDGINELPAGQQADKYGQVRRFLAEHPELMAWVSCREQDYPPDRDLQLDRVTVAPLDVFRVQEFIHNYLDGRPEFGSEAADDLFWQLVGEKAKDTWNDFMKEMGPKLADPARVFWLEQELPDGLAWGWGLFKYANRYWEWWLAARAHPANLLQLATNPYMLYMLLEVYQAHRTVPANRGQLFDQFVERLLLREALFAWDEQAQLLVRLGEGEALLTGLTELAYEMQRRATTEGRGDGGTLTMLRLDVAAAFLDEQQRYQAASANLLVLGDGVRFAHQLLQEYFVARAMRERVFGQSGRGRHQVASSGRLSAADIWPPHNWWEPIGWEEATILLAGLFSDDCTPVLEWLADAQPEVAARCITESGAHTPDGTKLHLRSRWLPRLTDSAGDPDAGARAAVGCALGQVTLTDGMPLDNRPGVGIVVRRGAKVPDIAWGREVPAGVYTIGGDEAARRSFEKRTVAIPSPYRFSRYPITNIQFQCFIDAPDGQEQTWWKGIPDDERLFSSPRFAYTNHPCETVSWYQAIAFCRWLTAKLHAGELAGEVLDDPAQYEITLPHEYEWEVAARWPDNRFYPWGNDFDPVRANTAERNWVGPTTAVGIYPSGRNEALELYDLCGNVWEWCRNKYDNPGDEIVDRSNDWRVVRGGSWSSFRRSARATYRHNYPPDHRLDDYGYRVVVRRRLPHPKH